MMDVHLFCNKDFGISTSLATNAIASFPVCLPSLLNQCTSLYYI